jgi:8-oxo-dGTP pyrophosphatase MutT (NUDIX family)
MSELQSPTGELSIEDIRTRLEKYCREESGYHGPYVGRRAAVLVPLYWEGGEWHVLFTRRSEAVNDHKGQVSFPGGAVESTDRNVYTAALREAHEEIGLEKEDVEILGRLKDYMSISDFVISPIIARITWPFTIRINPAEVSRVFSIPLSYLGDAAHIETRIHILPNGKSIRLFYFTPYDGELLWGITARIMVRLLKVLGYLEDSF